MSFAHMTLQEKHELPQGKVAEKHSVSIYMRARSHTPNLKIRWLKMASDLLGDKVPGPVSVSSAPTQRKTF